MARGFANTATGGTAVDYFFNTTTSPVTARKWSQGCLFKDPVSATQNDRLMMEITDSTTAYINRLGINDDASTKIYFREKANAGAPAAVSSNTYSDDTWTSAIGGTDLVNLRNVWLAGTKTTESTTATNAPTGLDEIVFGAERVGGSPVDGFNGDMGEWFVVSRELDDAEVTMLSSAPFVSPAFLNDLVFYCPGFHNSAYTGDEFDIVGGLIIGQVGSPTTTAHPPVIYPCGQLQGFLAADTATAAVTGTATDTINEADVVTGGKTIIITLTNDTFKAAGTGPIGTTANTQALIDNIDSAQSEGTGWDAEVKANLVPADDVVRDSSTQATVTLSAQAAYDITAQETITVTVPTDVLVTAAGAITGSPTFTVGISGTSIPVFAYHYNHNLKR